MRACVRLLIDRSIDGLIDSFGHMVGRSVGRSFFVVVCNCFRIELGEKESGS